MTNQQPKSHAGRSMDQPDGVKVNNVEPIVGFNMMAATGIKDLTLISIETPEGTRNFAATKKILEDMGRWFLERAAEIGSSRQ